MDNLTSYNAHNTTRPNDAAPGGLASLDDLSEYKVADGFPDPRGWAVKTPGGQKVGKVEDLIVEPAAMRARYLEVKLDHDAFGFDRDRRVLVPVGTVRLDDDRDDVLLEGLSAARLAALPPFAGGPIGRDYETALRRRLDQRFAAPGDGEDYYAHSHFDQDRFVGRRRAGADGEQYLTLAEERLAVGKRQAQGGEVELRKVVVTERVRQQVPVAREEVTVERRPITDAGVAGDARIGEEEITVPLMAEEVVVEKRVVPTEEVIVRKEARVEQQTVEAGVRRERLEVDRTGQATGPRDADARERR